MKISINKKEETIFLVVLGIISIALRFYRIDRPDFYFDEGIQALAMKDFIATKNIADLYMFGHPPLFMLAIYPISWVFGVNEYALRAVEAFFGVLSVFVVYYCAKMWYGRKYALLSSILFAVLPFSVLYSRMSYAYIVSMFFTILSIFSIEYLIRNKFNKKNELIMVVVCGILIGLTMLTRYNSLIIFMLYWMFILSYSFLKERGNLRKYLYYAILSNIIAILLFLITVLYLGGIPRLIYVVNGILYAALRQTIVYTNPFYYHLAVLFDGVSPFLYLFIPFALLSILINKKRTRTDMLLAFLVFTFLIISTIQAHKYSRHQIVIYPFLIILISRFAMDFFSNYRAKIQIGIFLFIILGTLSWTIFLIHETYDFNIWTKVGSYIDKNFDKSVVVHSGFIRNRQIRTHVPRYIEGSMNISQLNKGDLVIFAFLNKNSTVLENSPFEDKSTLFKNNFAAEYNRRNEFDEEYYTYVLRHGSLVKIFDYKGGTAVWIYQINDTIDKFVSYANKHIVEHHLPPNTSIFGLWTVVCDLWNSNNLSNRIMNSYFSKEQIASVRKKCEK